MTIPTLPDDCADHLPVATQEAVWQALTAGDHRATDYDDFTGFHGNDPDSEFVTVADALADHGTLLPHLAFGALADVHEGGAHAYEVGVVHDNQDLRMTHQIALDEATVCFSATGRAAALAYGLAIHATYYKTRRALKHLGVDIDDSQD